MNISLNKNDYSSLEQFRDVLEDALSKKARTLRKRIALSLDTEKSYKDSLYHYLYWKLLDEFEDSYDSLKTHEITVTETGGTGGYYLNDGYFRKAGNDVIFKVYPPDETYISLVTCNDEEILQIENNQFSFMMPNEDAIVEINYATLENTTVIYWGLSVDGNVDLSATNKNTLITPLTNPFEVTINFNNVGNPAYLWIASKIELNTQTLQGLGSTTTNDTFNISTVEYIGETYYLYIHKWATELNMLKLSE
jgi:hypothetical protein